MPYNSYCHECNRQYKREYYHRHPEKKSRWYAVSKSRKDALRNFITSAKSRPCKDCGREYPYYVMDFDHIPGRGDKAFKLSIFRGRSLVNIEREIAKCDVVCSNCHRIRTHNRKQHLNIKSSAHDQTPATLEFDF